MRCTKIKAGKERRACEREEKEEQPSKQESQTKELKRLEEGRRSAGNNANKASAPGGGMLQEVSSDDVNRYQNGHHAGNGHDLNGAAAQSPPYDSRPPLPKKQQSGSSFHPINEWLPSAADHHGAVGLSHAGRDRRRREMMEYGSPHSPLLPVAEQKGGHAMERRRAIQATIWSFIATAVFAFGFILPYRGRKDTVDFVTGFLVEKSLSVDNLFVFLMIFEYFKGAVRRQRIKTYRRGSPSAGL